MKKYIPLESIQALVFDFDGVLTNNFVVVGQDGSESVTCSRSDGLAFDVLRKVNKPAYILSTEKNKVVRHLIQMPLKFCRVHVQGKSFAYILYQTLPPSLIP